MRRTFLRLVVAGVMVAGGGMALADPAEADTPGCVTEREYLTVYRHERIVDVNDHFDTVGQLFDAWGGGGYYDEIRTYRKCPSFDGGRGRVGVWFDNYSHDAAGYTDARLRLYRKVPFNPWNLYR